MSKKQHKPQPLDYWKTPQSDDDKRALKSMKSTWIEKGMEKGRALDKAEVRAAYDAGWNMHALVSKSAVHPILAAIGELRCTLTHIYAYGQMPLSIAVLRKAIETDQLKLGEDVQSIKVAYNQLLSYYPNNPEMAQRAEQDIALIIDSVNPYDAACSAVTRGDEKPLRTLARQAVPSFESLTVELQNMGVGRNTDPETIYLFQQGELLKTDGRTWKEATNELIARLTVGVASGQYAKDSLENRVLMMLTESETDAVSLFKQAYLRMAKRAY